MIFFQKLISEKNSVRQEVEVRRSQPPSFLPHRQQELRTDIHKFIYMIRIQQHFFQKQVKLQVKICMKYYVKKLICTFML